MKNLLLLVFLFSVSCYLSKGQDKYRINDFLSGYILEYAFQNSEDEIIEAYALYKKEELIFHTDNNQILKNATNIKEVSYAEMPVKNILLTEDYNFDGKPDIVIWYEQANLDNYYHPGTRSFYLSEVENYIYNESLSTLVNNILLNRRGDYFTKPKEKRLVSFVGSGCCKSYYTEYTYQGKNLIKVSEYMEDGLENPLYVEVKGYDNVKGTKKKLAYYYLLEREDCETVFSFTTANNKGVVKLFKYKNELFYAFIQDEGKIYFAYPSRPEEGKASFVYSKSNKELSFSSGSVVYSIFENGIRIRTNGKLTVWEAGNNQVGNLNMLLESDLHNLKKEY